MNHGVVERELAWVSLNPLRSQGRFVEYDRGQSLADIANEIPLEHPDLRSCLTCRVGAVRFEPALWHLYKPKPGMVPSFTLLPAGGRIGVGRIFAATAAVALIAASFYVPGSSPWALAAVQALRAAGAVALSFAIQGFRRKPPQSSLSSGQGLGSASGTNDFDPNGPLPMVLGTARVWPKTVVPPARLWVGNDEYVYAAFDLAGSHQISDVRSGDDKLDDAEDALVEIQTGLSANTPMTLLDRGTRIDSNPGIRLSEWSIDENYSDTEFPPLKGTADEAAPQWHAFETKRNPDKVFIGYEFPIGLDQVQQAAGVFLRHRLRAVGATTWIMLPDLLVANQINAPFRVGLEIQFVDAIPPTAGNDWLNESGQDIKGFFDLNPFVAGSEAYATPTGGIRGYEEWLWAEKKVILFLLRADFPAARYQFEAKRSWPFIFADYDQENRALDYHPPELDPTFTLDFFASITILAAPAVPHNPSAFVDDVQLTLVTSIFDEYPIDDSIGLPAARIAVQLKNRTLNPVNCIASKLTEAGLTSPSPAFWSLFALTSPHNADPVDIAQIRTSEFDDWDLRCGGDGLEVNAVLDGTSLDEVLDICAEAGFAVPRRGPIFGVVQDRERTDPFTGAVTLRNASGFGWQKTLDDRPHAIKATFRDAVKDYGESEIIVYADGYNADGSSGLIQASRFEARRYDNITSESQIRARALHDLRWIQFRSTTITATMEVENFEHEMGSRMLVQLDSLKAGGQARVKEVIIEAGLVTGLELDEYADIGEALSDLYEMEDLYEVEDLYASLTPGIQIRLRSGAFLSKEIDVPTPALSSHIDFTTPFSMPTLGGNPQILRGSLVLLGVLGHEARDMLLWGAAPARNNQATLTFVDTANAEMFA